MEAHNYTTLCAVWGAIIGTLSFFWNIIKWRHEKPRLAASVEALKSFENEDEYGGIRLTLRNRGGQKTTVENIVLYRRLIWLKWLWCCLAYRRFHEHEWEHSVSAAISESTLLPTVLEANSVWSGFIPLKAYNEEDEKELRRVERNRYIAEALRSGTVRFAIRCAHTKRAKTGNVKSKEYWQQDIL